mmetsp:Transcript_34818/g.88231  ORF Transcript_34818/g.88231 Transcript_34818/m.88231 type:complete len:133 (-) Transcript_34818:646-1044(-)
MDVLTACDVASADQAVNVKAVGMIAAKTSWMGGDALAQIMPSLSKNAKGVKAVLPSKPDCDVVRADDSTAAEAKSKAIDTFEEFSQRWMARRMGRRISHHGHVGDTLLPLYESDLQKMREKDGSKMPSVQEH